MKQTLLAVLLAAAIAAVGYWGVAGSRGENKELSEMKSAYQTEQQKKEALQQQKAALEEELTALIEKNREENETLQSWTEWKEALQKELAG